MSHVSGLAYLELLNDTNYYLPCDIEWGSEGKYLIFPLKYHQITSGDLFTIENIQILSDNKVLCKLYNPIETPTNEIFREVMIELFFDQYDKIIEAGIADNVIDMDITITDIKTDVVQSTNNVIDKDIKITETETETDVIQSTNNKTDLMESINITNPIENKIIKKTKWYKPWRYFW